MIFGHDAIGNKVIGFQYCPIIVHPDYGKCFVRISGWCHPRNQRNESNISDRKRLRIRRGDDAFLFIILLLVILFT